MIRNHESYSMESGDKTENMNTLQDYESYGIVYHPKDGYWYYNDQIIGIFIDTKKPIIYFNNSGSIYLSIAENSENGVMEIKEISEAEAQKLLRDNNSGNSASFTVETLK
jgi:bla regulator protein BlaR1